MRWWTRRPNPGSTIQPSEHPRLPGVAGVPPVARVERNAVSGVYPGVSREKRACSPGQFSELLSAYMQPKQTLHQSSPWAAQAAEFSLCDIWVEEFR